MAELGMFRKDFLLFAMCIFQPSTDQWQRQLHKCKENIQPSPSQVILVLGQPKEMGPIQAESEYFGTTYLPGTTQNHC